MVIKTANGWQVTSKDNKPLSNDNLTEAEARKREREIIAFKYMHQQKLNSTKQIPKVVKTTINKAVNQQISKVKN